MRPLLFLLLFATCIVRVEAQQGKPESIAAPSQPAVQKQPPGQQMSAQQVRQKARQQPPQPAVQKQTPGQQRSAQQVRQKAGQQPPQPAVQKQTPGQQRSAQQVRQKAGQQPPQPADSACKHCNQSERLIVDLIYYKQALDILEQIDQQRSRINPELLRLADKELIRIRPELRPLLQTRLKPSPPATPPKVTKKPVKTAQKPKKPTKPAPKSPPKQGLDGLVVGHVNDANQELGIKASVVLISNGRPRSLSIGGGIEHNRRKYKIIRVDYVENSDKGNRHDVHLQDQTSKKIHVVPWQ